MEFSTNKITPNDNVKIPSMNGNNSGYQLDSELREYVQAGVSGVTEQYSNLSTYAYGKRLKHEGVEYRCIVPVETPENFDPDKWVKVDLTELDKRILENASAINAIMNNIESKGLTPSDNSISFQLDGNSPYLLVNSDWGSLWTVLIARGGSYGYNSTVLSSNTGAGATTTSINGNVFTITRTTSGWGTSFSMIRLL